MAEETITIFRADTGEAVRSIGDLKASIKELKQQLEGMDIGSKEYADTLVNLQTQQAALKNAMHDTTFEADSEKDAFAANAKAAMGLGDSYNALVRRMADLDQQFRSTEDAVKRAELGKEINEINNRLKEMDEERGKFGRNVGNYKSALEGLAGGFKATAGAAGSIINPVKNVTAGFKALSTTPVIAVLGLLANALTKVSDGLKSSEENTNAWNRALAAFKPIADSFTRTMQSVGKVIADTANWIVDLLDKWGLLSEAAQQRIALEEQNQYIIKLQRQTARENADLENEVAQLRDKAARKDKYTAQERLQFLEDAAKWEQRIAANNKRLAQERLRVAEEEAALTENSAETNEKLNQLRIAAVQADTNYLTTVRRIQSQISATRLEIQREGGKIIKEQMDVTRELIAALEGEELNEEIFPDFIWDPDGEVRAANQQLFDDLIAQRDAYDAAVANRLEWEKAAEEAAADWQVQQNERRLNSFIALGSAVADIAAALADVYESDAEASEEAAAKSKALQTGAAIVQTITGAVSAYMSTWKAPELGLVAKSILAPLNAATVLAAGYAQIRKINAVKVGSGSGGNTGAAVTAPAATPSIQQVRTVTGRTAEDRLNRMASDTRVYLVYSDVERAQAARRVQVQETEF